MTTKPIDPHLITRQLRGALDDAEAFVTQMPSEELGLLFLQGSKIVQPDPTRLESYQTHGGTEAGAMAHQ
jgi:hypothetical protein